MIDKKSLLIALGCVLLVSVLLTLQQRQHNASLPRPLSLNTTQKTMLYGQSTGQSFQFIAQSSLQLHKINLRSGTQIDNLQLIFTDGQKFTFSQAVGGKGGDQKGWQVPQGEYVSQVEVRSGDRIDALRFITNKGNKSPQFGGNGGQYHLVVVPENHRIIGIYGTQDGSLYKLGFIFAEKTYQKDSLKKSNLVYQ